MINLKRLIGAWLLTGAMCLSGSLFFVVPAQAAEQRLRDNTTQTNRANAAYQRGYPYGYSDGFAAGRNDYLKRLDQDFRTAAAYQRADRGYRTSYGARQDFESGYRLGYELGYVDGYYGRSYSVRLPNNALNLYSRVERDDANRQTANFIVPNGTRLTLRLDTTINTKTSQRGDRFFTNVVSPREYEGALIEGHIAQLDRSGRVSGKTELTLAFDTITLRNGRSGPIRGEVKELIASESVKAIDEEGNIESANKTKDTTLRTGGGAALGAIIGAIAGGGKGAAIGALIGAGVGAGSVYVQGKKDLVLEPGTEMVMEVAGPSYNTSRR